jgi:putative SOS response-associated peptidase YedK
MTRKDLLRPFLFRSFHRWDGKGSREAKTPWFVADGLSAALLSFAIMWVSFTND